MKLTIGDLSEALARLKKKNGYMYNPSENEIREEAILYVGEQNGWLIGFFEGQVSFSVNISLTSTKNKRYVFFKPNIIISNSDEHQLKFIVDVLQLKTNITKKKKRDSSHNDCHTLNIQDLSDICNVIDKLSNCDFVSQIKKEKFQRFVDCCAYITRNNLASNTEWKESFVEALDKKLKINDSRSNIASQRYSKEVWVNKIKDHLDS